MSNDISKTAGGKLLPTVLSQHDNDPDTRTVTQSEAAKRMQVSRSTIYRLAKDGDLASVPMRGRTRIVLASVFDYICKHKEEGKNG